MSNFKSCATSLYGVFELVNLKKSCKESLDVLNQTGDDYPLCDSFFFIWIVCKKFAMKTLIPV